MIEPDEYELWKSHVEYIREPLQSLFDLGLAFYLLDEQRDLLLQPTLGGLTPTERCIDWRIRYFALVPRYGCFQLSRSGPLHRFDQSCSSAAQAFLQTQKNSDTGAFIYKNALYAGTPPGSENGVNLCNWCFPPSPGGQRITLEYVRSVTGLSEGQFQEICEAITGEPFLDGLA